MKKLTELQKARVITVVFSIMIVISMSLGIIAYVRNIEKEWAVNELIKVQKELKDCQSTN